MASGGKGSSPYVGVQKSKSKSGGYAVETRHFLYQGAKYKKFFHRIKDERKAAFISDFVNYFSGNNDSTLNFENGRKVLEEHGSRFLLELEEWLARCKWPALNPKRRKEELRKCFIHEAKKLWNEHKGEILKDHIRPSQEGSKNDVVEQLNHGHEDSVQKQDHIRSLHNGSSNITLEQLNHGCENRLAGECSMTKQTEEHVSNMTKQTEEHVSNMTKHIEEHGGSPKFDVDVELPAQPHEEPVLEKKLPVPPSLEKDPQSSCSQTQEDPNEGECSMTKQTEEHVSNMTKHIEEHAGLPKFDVDVGLLAQPLGEPVLNLSVPPSLEKDPQSSCSQTQEDPNEGIDARGQKTEQNQENKMEIRRDGYKKYLEISDKFLKSECSEDDVLNYLVQTDSTRTALLSVPPQTQCALYEEISDAINDVICSECIPKGILDKYRAETEPILKQCRANWHE